MPGQCYNFDSFSHRQLYDMIHGIAINDRGCFASSGAKGASERAWQEFTTLMNSVQGRVNKALAEAGAEWTGAAAEAAQGGITPLAQWANDAGTAGGHVHSSLGSQNGYYSTAKRDVPPPVNVDSTANSDFFGIPAGITHLVGEQTDQDEQEQHAAAAKAQAVRVMNTYQSNSLGVTGNLGTFTPPPSVTVDVPPPSPQQTGSGGPMAAAPWVAGAGGSGGSGARRPTGGPSGVSRVPANGPGGPFESRGGPPQVTGASSYVPPQSGGPGVRPLPPNQVPGGGPHANPIGDAMFGPYGGTGWGTGGSAGDGYGRSGRMGPRGGGFGSPEFGPRGSQQRPGGGPASGAGTAMSEEGVLGRGGGPAGARGAAGTSAMGPMGAGRGQQDDDREHRRPAYLQEIEDVWEGGIQRVAPPVIGEE